MSLYVKDLKIWSLFLACALNNDSVPTNMLCGAIYRYTAFVIISHSSMFSCLMLKMLWNPCWRHFLKIEKWLFIYRRSKLTLFAQQLDLEMWMSPSFFMETWTYGNSKSLRLGHTPAVGVHGAHGTEICRCLRLLPLSSTETGSIKLWMINLDVSHIVRDTHHVLIRRFLGKY